MRTETIELFKFEELSDKAKEKARDWWRDLATDDFLDRGQDTVENCIAEDYKDAGLSFKKAFWDIGRSWSFEPQNLTVDDYDKLLQKAGLPPTTDIDNLILSDGRNTRYSRYFRFEVHYNSESPVADRDTAEKLNQLLIDLEHKALKTLQSEYEYTNSDEYIDEMLICNEYEFTEDGEHY